MSRLTDLIAQAKAKDAIMGADLEREFAAISSRLAYGLNFERHRPEAVELPLRPVRKGDKVRVLPERGSTSKGDQRLWRVKGFGKAGGHKVAELELPEAAEAHAVPLDDLIVVAEFKDIIYPGLVSTGKVARGGDKPCHTVINGENYHVLKALTYTHRGKVDAIYIDPPYNTGAKDWKYNNDYVEGDDLYRHSKWLAMMERRLLIAKELLNPKGSVLADKDGKYPAELNQWERSVVETESKRAGFLFWYRNPQQPGQSSLGMAYVEDAQYKIVRPDFIFFAEQEGKVVVDLVDPHGLHLADALPKLQGLAAYAQEHVSAYRRIEAVAEVNGKLRVLDMTRAEVRSAVMEASSAKSLYEGALAGDYG